MTNKILKTLSAILLLSVTVFSIIPIRNTQAFTDGSLALEYPKLEYSKYDYYLTTFPSGLIYSSAWAGTFTYMPNGMKHVLFDDNYEVDRDGQEWGICVFSLPKGTPPPRGEQGGTSLSTIDKGTLDTLIKSYDLKELVKPWDTEILEIMEHDHKYVGAWAGSKLSQKFESVEQKIPVYDKESGEYEFVEQEYQLVDEEIVLVDVKVPLTERQKDYLEVSGSKKVSPVDLEKFDPDRYFVMGQAFFVDDSADCSLDGRVVVDSVFTVNGAGDFSIYMANGTTATVSGTNIFGSPIMLTPGLNTITATGAVNDGYFDIEIGTEAYWNDVNSWSATSGGPCGASVTTNADNAHFDANSFTGPEQTVVAEITSYCLDMNWTGVTDEPTLDVQTTSSTRVLCSGSITFIEEMRVVGHNYIRFRGSNEVSMTSNGLAIKCRIGTQTDFTGTLTIVDTFDNSMSSGSYEFWIQGGTVTLNGDVFTRQFVVLGDKPVEIDLGPHTVNCAYWYVSNPETVLHADDSIINVSSSLGFVGGDLEYNTVNLSGSTFKIRGSNTFNELNFDDTEAQTIMFEDGTTQTVNTFNPSGSVGKLHTMRGTGTDGWNLAYNGTSEVRLDYISVSNSTVTANTFYAGENSVDGGNNTNWIFASAVSSTSSKVTSISSASLTGNIIDTGTPVPTIRGFQYGTTSGNLTDIVQEVGIFTTGPYTLDVTGLKTGTTYYYRALTCNAWGTVYGEEKSFTTDPLSKMILTTVLPLMVALVIIIVSFSTIGVSLFGGIITLLIGLFAYILISALATSL